MAADKKWRLICYDVRDPKRYRKVYKIVRGVGRRVQYSIFRAHLDDRALEQTKWRLAQVMAEEDDLFIINLCPHCSRALGKHNDTRAWDTDTRSWDILD